MCQLHHLPSEVLEILLEYLELGDILNLDACCGALRCKTSGIWRRLSCLNLTSLHADQAIMVLTRTSASRGLTESAGDGSTLSNGVRTLIARETIPKRGYYRWQFAEPLINTCGRTLICLCLAGCYLEEGWILTIAHNTPKLTTADFADVRICGEHVPPFPNLKDSDLRNALLFWPELQQLTIAGSHQLVVQDISETMPRDLKVLDMNRLWSRDIRAGGISKMWERLKGLQSLALCWRPFLRYVNGHMLRNLTILYVDCLYGLAKSLLLPLQAIHLKSSRPQTWVHRN